MTDVLLVAVDHDLASRVAAFDGFRVVSIGRENGRTPRGYTPDMAFKPDVIFVGSELSTDRALEYARVVTSEYPEIAVIMVAEPDTDLVHRATAAGIRGVIDARIGNPDLLALLDRVGRDIKPATSNSGPQPHQVIVVASPKGGVGKSTTAVNLAALLAESAPGEVVLIDLDLQFGDVATLLDLQPAYTITDAFTSGVDDSMRLRTLLTPHPGNFYVLCGSENPAENGRVTGDQMRKLVHHYSASFRFVVVDTPAGLHEETLASLEEATDVVLVATIDVACLRAMRREVDVLAELFLLPQRRHVVLNRADRRSGLTERDVERILGLPVDVVIPVSEGVALSANRGELAIASKKLKDVRKSFTQVARKVADLTNQRPGEGSR